jgi:hypothetical protein
LLDCLPPHLPKRSFISLHSPSGRFAFLLQVKQIRSYFAFGFFLLHSPAIVEAVEIIVYPVLYSTVFLKVREKFHHSEEFAPLENVRLEGVPVYYTVFLQAELQQAGYTDNLSHAALLQTAKVYITGPLSQL